SLGTPTTDDLSPWTGVGLSFWGPACVDASAYSGAEFTLGGDPGGCQVRFGFDYAEVDPSADDPQQGLCSQSSCYLPEFVLVAASGVTTVSFNRVPDFPGSSAGPVDSKKLTGVRWALYEQPSSPAPCSGSLAISSVSFY
ncbi:MAG TPA: hypothetical protein VMT03_01600, partial [Polyangia bacterium]|nr:hypothetical protein [Polyangia bacterium]